MIRTVLIDRQSAFTECLRTTLEKEGDFLVCGTGHNKQDLVELMEMFRPDILLLEWEIEEHREYPMVHLVKRCSPETEIIFITRVGPEQEPLVNNKMLAGISRSRSMGCVSRENAFLETVKACRLVSKGRAFLTPVIAEKAFLYLREVICEGAPTNFKSVRIALPDTHKDSDGSKIGLHHAEYQVVTYIGQGMNNAEIAEEMGITKGTVRNHISNILRKTGLENRTQVAIHANNGSFIRKRRIKPEDSRHQSPLYAPCLSASSVPFGQRKALYS